ncbi:hypothetical protein [Sphingobacterium kitahiroshimense]|uniref:DUF4926 domain-containing protein n=1 Tax=Sphingobacterium kitahiroshimense TaxID=470446 RepID=A0ABV0BNZ1_9SPHI
MKALIGKPVLVHLLLPIDPAGRQGHLGTISNLSYDNEIVEVCFEDGEKSLYLTDALLVFKSHWELSRDLTDGHQRLDAEELKTLIEIHSILEKGAQSGQHEAFRRACSSERLLRLATVSLASRLELTLPEDTHPYWKKGTGR